MFNKLGDLTVEVMWEGLPPASHNLCYWGDSPDTGPASGQISAGVGQATGALSDWFNKAAGYLQPYRQAGEAGVGQWAGLLGLPGYKAVDPSAMLQQTPGYQFLQNQGNQALARYGAASGLSMSGPAAKSALNFGQNLAQSYAWQPYMSSLQSLTGMGEQAAGQTGQWAYGTGQNMANTYMTGAQLQSQLAMQQAMMDAQSQNAMWGDIMGGLGFGASMAMGGLGGGDSWLSRLFGGGGALPSYSGAMSGMPGMNIGQMSNVGQNGYGAFMPSSGGGWIPLMADGGPASGGQPYIVGERGPELFIPNVPGYVVPNEYVKYSSFGDDYSQRYAA